jgi:hypothetical protein
VAEGEEVWERDSLKFGCFLLLMASLREWASGMDRGRVTGKGNAYVVSTTAYAVGEGYGC